MRPSRRSLAGIAAILAAAIAVTAVFEWPSGRAATRCETLLAAGGPTGQSTGPTGPTIAEPLSPPAKRMTLASARSAFGVSVPLPNTPAVRPADLGAVWEGVLSGDDKSIKVTFPSRGLMVFYRRPPPIRDPAKAYRADAAQMSDARFVELNGTPALVIAENSDDTCANFGVVDFHVNGTEVEVMGHKKAAPLEAIARSILARWPV